MKIDEILKQQGIVSTGLRVDMFRLLMRAKKPLSYDDMLKKLNVNKTTIYRNLQLFEEHGLVGKSEIGGKGYYELASREKARFVCNVCHEIHNVNMPILSGGEVATSAVIKGVCKECAQ